MKTCSSCGETNVDSNVTCWNCHELLPSGPVIKIEELEEWNDDRDNEQDYKNSQIKK